MLVLAWNTVQNNELRMASCSWLRILLCCCAWIISFLSSKLIRSSSQDLSSFLKYMCETFLRPFDHFPHSAKAEAGTPTSPKANVALAPHHVVSDSDNIIFSQSCPLAIFAGVFYNWTKFPYFWDFRPRLAPWPRLVRFDFWVIPEGYGGFK